MRNYNLAWSVSLLVIAVASLVIGLCNMIGIPLSIWVVRVLGVADLAALPVLAFTTVKKFQKRA